MMFTENGESGASIAANPNFLWQNPALNFPGKAVAPPSLASSPQHPPLSALQQLIDAAAGPSNAAASAGPATIEYTVS